MKYCIDRMMAEGEKTTNLQDILTCAVCLDVLDNPVIFPCIHHFCRSCKDQLNPCEQDGICGVLCPICKQFTPSDHIKNDFVMQQIVHVHSQRVLSGDVKERVCDFCTEETAQHRCVECKSTLCDGCKKGHIRIPTCRGHTIKQLKDDNKNDKVVIDAIVFCKEHPDKMIEFNCSDCDQAICYKCKVINHNLHTTQTVQDAIKATLPIVKEKMVPLDKDISILAEEVKSLHDLITRTKEQQESLQNEVENRKQELIKKITADGTKIKEEVHTTHQARIKELEHRKSDVEHHLSSKESVKNRSDMLINHFKDASLLIQLQDDILGILNKEQTYQKPPDMVQLHRNLQFVEYDDNLVATLTHEGPTVINIQQKISELVDKNKALKKNLKEQVTNLQKEKETSTEQITNLLKEKETLTQNLKEQITNRQKEKETLTQNFKAQITKVEKEKETMQNKNKEYSNNAAQWHNQIERLKEEVEKRNVVLRNASPYIANQAHFLNPYYGDPRPQLLEEINILTS